MNRLLVLLVLAAACNDIPALQRPDEPADRPPAAPPVEGYHVASATDLEGPFTNRLASQTSPYLKQHQHNPVDWYPWGDEAFEQAIRRGVPVFLSIGYAACHWCHVMEEESFEDPEIAAILNANFVAIKVDREERPDVDAVYMDALNKMNGRGGWPASLFLNHERQPFFAGTYFPKETRLNRIGFRDLLAQIQTQWTESPQSVQEDAMAVAIYLRRAATVGPMSEVDWDAPRVGAIGMRNGWDEENKGWGGKKFPMLSRLELLLSYGVAHTHGNSLAMVKEQLDAMDRGGIHDHLGGGFHRYTVDAAWRVPHFEKMLYDNGQFLRIYAEASTALDSQRYHDVATGIVTYLMRDMRDPANGGGAFYSSEDADSGGEEGTFYVWTESQVRAVIGGPAAKEFAAAYAITPKGNFEKGTTVLSRPSADPATPALIEARAALHKARASRVPPPKDTKRVVAYNGMTIAGLARGGRLLDEPTWTAAAARAADACLAARAEDGALPRTLEPGSPLGVIDDYAFLAEGLLDLYEATGEIRWLVAADDLAADMTERFWDPVLGGFFFSDSATKGLLIRQKDMTDGARPSGAGRAMVVLARLRAYGAHSGSGEQLQLGLLAAGRWLNRSPSTVPSLLHVVEGINRGTMEVIIAVPAGRRDLAAPYVAAFNEDYRPHAVLGWSDPADGEVVERFGALAGKVPDGEAARVYVCFDGICKQPTSDLAEVKRLMAR